MPDNITASDTTASDTVQTATEAALGAPDTTAGRATGAADKLRAALHARPSATADELATAAGIGHSTAGKILARWVHDDTVERTPGPRNGKRTASRFTPTTSHPAPAAAAPADTPDGGTHPHSATDPHNGTDSAPDRTDEVGDGAVTGDPSNTDTAHLGADGDHNAVSDEPTDTDSRADDPTRATTATTATTAHSLPPRSPRLAAGELHGLVEDYLRDHPNDEFGPTKIGHDLGRSSGAISNALERLVASGDALRTNDRPKRYRLTPVQMAAASQA